MASRFFKNHPRGLMPLFFTEMWERFGFYTMLAVFTLYMNDTLAWDDAKKGDVYGIFLAAVYFTPVAGGWIADRIGYRIAIMIGSVVMTVGYFALGLSGPDALWMFYLALAILVVGNGLFKANISVLLGNIYPEKSPYKDVGYNIFYMGINVGALAAPLVATLLNSLSGRNYNYCFYAASLGMLASLVIFHLTRRSYAHGDLSARGREQPVVKSETSEPEEPEREENERERIVALIIIFAIVVFFWMSFHQNGYALTLFAKRSTVQYDWLEPETYQVFNPLFILLLTPLVVATWNALRRRGREPTSPAKIGLGMFISGFAMVIMVVASALGGDADANNMAPTWLISSYFVITIGELCLSPMGLSFVSKVSPTRMRGLMMGGWFAATAIGNYLSGFIGKYYSTLTHTEFFGILTGLLFMSAFFVLLFLKKLVRASASSEEVEG